MRLRTQDLLSDEARSTLAVLGERLKLARIRRRESQKQAAQRLKTTDVTLRRLEQGDPSLSISLYLAALDIYGFLDQVRVLADPDTDQLGKALDRQRQPKHIHPEPLDNDF